MNWLRRHALMVSVSILAPLSLAIFLWAEWGYFQDQARDHGEPVPTEFFSSAHMHDLIYNAAANWQSELIFGVLIVMLLKKIEGNQGADKEDT